MATSIANGFRAPFNGDHYIIQEFNVPNNGFRGLFHHGEDLAPLRGTSLAIHAIANGEIVRVSASNAGFGNYALVRHDLPYAITISGVTVDAVTVMYAHLNGAPARPGYLTLAPGDIVTAGEQIGIMGSTGASGGTPHLHFEIRLGAHTDTGPGYSTYGPMNGWADPSDFIAAYPSLGAIVGTGIADALSGNVGSDSLTGAAGADTLRGGDGGDMVYGNQGADALYGEDGADTLFGGQDADLIYGNAADDLLYGNLGADALYGGAGADTLYGGQGDDTLVGGAGDDVLAGNLGADRFVISGSDSIVDFDAAEGDRIAAAAALAAVADGATGAVASFTDGSTVVLLGITAAAVSADWFGGS